MRVVEIIADLHVEDIEKARQFYVEYPRLLSTEEFNMGWVARYTSPATGVNLQLITHYFVAPEDPVITVKVDDVDAGLRRNAAARRRDRLPPAGRALGSTPLLRRGTGRQRPEHRAPSEVSEPAGQ